MAEENKHPPTTEEQTPPEMPGKAPEKEQAEIPDVGAGPAPSAKVIDLSAVRSTPEKDAPTDIPKEPEAQPVSVTEYSKQEWKKPMPEPEKTKPKRGRPAKSEKAAPTEPGAKKEAQAEKPRRGRPSKAEKVAPEETKPPKAGKTHAAPEEKAAPPAPEVPPTPRDATRAEKEEIVYLDLSDLHPFKDHPFGVRDDAEMKSLVESVRNGGVNQPALVRPREGGGYEIIAGERRWQACRSLGMETIPVRFWLADDTEAFEAALVENIQRSDLNPIEEAYGYKRLMERKGMTQSEVAQTVSKGRSTIANALRLLDLPEEAQQLLFEEKITAGHARAILSVPTLEGKKSLTNKLMEEKLSVRETEAIARLLAGREKAASTPSSRVPTPQSFKKAARSMSKILELPVRVKTVQGKNKIEIQFKDEDELQRVVAVLSEHKN